MIYLLILSAVVIGVLGQLLMKHGVSLLGGIGSGGLATFFLKAAFSPWIIAGIFAYVFGTGIWLVLLSKVEVSFAYPMLSLGYIFLLLLSAFFFHEQITPIRIMGVILIVLGVSLVARS